MAANSLLAEVIASSRLLELGIRLLSQHNSRQLKWRIHKRRQQATLFKKLFPVPKLYSVEIYDVALSTTKSVILSLFSFGHP